MGHWQICIESNAVPQSGNGNNRPVSPCEQGENEGDENNEDQEETPQINKPIRTNPVPNRTTNPRTPQPTQNENQVNPGTLRNNPNPRGGASTGGGTLQRPRP